VSGPQQRSAIRLARAQAASLVIVGDKPQKRAAVDESLFVERDTFDIFVAGHRPERRNAVALIPVNRGVFAE